MERYGYLDSQAAETRRLTKSQRPIILIGHSMGGLIIKKVRIVANLPQNLSSLLHAKLTTPGRPSFSLEMYQTSTTVFGLSSSWLLPTEGLITPRCLTTF